MSGLPAEATRAAVIKELPLDDSNGRFTVPDVTILRRMGYSLNHIPALRAFCSTARRSTCHNLRACHSMARIA